MSGLGLQPAFRRGLRLGVRFLKFRLRLIKAGAGATALRYRTELTEGDRVLFSRFRFGNALHFKEPEAFP